jgi:hypothetical protein
MRDDGFEDSAKVMAGAITAIVIVGLAIVIAMAFLWLPPS